MKDHEIRELVNTITSVAKAYGETQQLRQRIHDALVPKIEKLRSDKRMFQDTANALEVVVCMYTHFTGDPPYVGDEGLVLAIKEQADELTKFHNIMDAHPELSLLLKAESKSQVKRLAAHLRTQTKDES